MQIDSMKDNEGAYQHYVHRRHLQDEVVKAAEALVQCEPAKYAPAIAQLRQAVSNLWANQRSTDETWHA